MHKRRLATPPERGEADGKRTLGESPALPGVFHHHPCGDDLHIPKSVLTARWHEQSAV
nr:MAG TPA: hypothetical protein [Bacteriophage sp.]